MRLGKIIVVDDDPGSRIGLGRLLKAYGRSVETFDSAETALVGFKHGKISAAVLDVRLPGMFGDELARRLKRLLPRLNIIFVTGECDADKRLHQIVPGCNILPKPVQVERLLKLLGAA